MDELERLSIIVVTWNGNDLLVKCLESLAVSCGALPEIVVVDNANLVSTREIAERYRNVTYVATGSNLGFAGGNNIGLRYCHREFVVLLNNDTIVHVEPFTVMIQYLMNHAKVGVVQGTMTMPLREGRPDACGHVLTPIGEVLERLYPTMDSMQVTTASAVYSAKGALMLFKRDLPEKIGGLFYDEYRNNFEDVDFCARVWLVGQEVHYVPTGAVEHLCGQSLAQLNRTDVFRQAEYNHLFTLLTVLSTSSALYIVSGWFVWNLFANMCVLARQLDSRGLVSLCSVCRRLLKTCKRIREVRRRVQSLRAVSDTEIFRRVMVRKPLKYYWNQLRGNPLLFDD